MKIFVYDSGHVDFEGPVYMTEEQKEVFIEKMKKLVPQIGATERTEKVKKPPESIDSGTRKKWTPEEYVALLGPKSNKELAAMLPDRSEFAIDMKRGSFVPKFLKWMKNKGYASIKEVDEAVVITFLKEKGRM